LNKRLTEWKGIYSGLQRSILNIQNLAVRSAGLVSDYLNACLPISRTANQKDLQSFRDTKTLQDLCSKTDDVVKEIKADIDHMKVFVESLPNNQDRSNGTIPQLIEETIDRLIRIIQPVPPLSSKLISLLDNTTVPGLMRSILFLLPPEQADHVNTVIEGRRSSAESFDAKGDTQTWMCFRKQTRPKNVEAEQLTSLPDSSPFIGLLGVSHMIKFDLTAALDSSAGSLRHFDGPTPKLALWEYSVNSTYGLLEVALKEFEQSLVVGSTNENVRRTPLDFLPRFLQILCPCAHGGAIVH